MLLWPLIAIFLDNLLLVTAARYRFSALPFLCVAAGLDAARRPTRRELFLLAGFALVLVPNLSGLRLRTPGDGLGQEGYLRLALEPGSAAARAALARAAGRPRRGPWRANSWRCPARDRCTSTCPSCCRALTPNGSSSRGAGTS